MVRCLRHLDSIQPWSTYFTSSLHFLLWKMGIIMFMLSAGCRLKWCHVYKVLSMWPYLEETPILGPPIELTSKEPACQCRRHKRHRFDPWVGKILWKRAQKPTPVFLPRESHEQWSLMGYSPKGHRVKQDWSELARTHPHNKLIKKCDVKEKKKGKLVQCKKYKTKEAKLIINNLVLKIKNNE